MAERPWGPPPVPQLRHSTGAEAVAKAALPACACFVTQVTIAYPDEGAWKRFHYQFQHEGYPEVICTKVRDGAKRIVRLKVRGGGVGRGDVSRGQQRAAIPNPHNACMCVVVVPATHN